MKIYYFLFVLNLIGLFNWSASAAIIFSKCPVASTQDQKRIDRYKETSLHATLHQYAEELPAIGRYLQWLVNRQSHSNLNMVTDQPLREAGYWLEDLQLTSALTSPHNVTCDTDSKKLTLPYAIVPLILRSIDKNHQSTYRMRFKLCEYYADEVKQILMDNECKILGDSSGYDFKNLEHRFNSLKDHIEHTRELMRDSTYIIGALGTFSTLRFLRFLKLGSLASLSLALLPSGAAYYAVQQNYPDDLMRNSMDLRDAAEIAVDGDLKSAVSVSMPIQDFVPFFERYLAAITNSMTQPTQPTPP